MLPEHDAQLLYDDKSLLYEDLEPREILSSLRRIFTENDCEEIWHKVTRHDRVVIFCRRYAEKATSLEPLRNALQATANDHIWEGLVGSDAVTVPAMATPPSASHEVMLIRAKVPRRPDGYVEREELLQMIKEEIRRLLSGLSGWFVVHGMAGCGKSVLVAEAVRDRSLTNDRLLTDLFWINVGPTVNAQQVFALVVDLYSKMGKECAGLEMAEVKNRVTAMFLSEYQKALVILDDVWTDMQVRCFDELGCRIVATTRNADIFDVVPDGKKTVKMLPCGMTYVETLQAFAYWLGAADLVDLPAEAMQIFQKCRGNPFFIALVGSLIKKNRNRWSYYLNHLNSGRLSHIRKLSQYSYPTFNDSMLPSLNNLSPDLKTSYFELGIFPLGAQLNSHLLSIFWEVPLEEAEDRMATFAERSLVTVDPLPDKTFGFKLYKIHELCHLVTKLKQEKERTAFHRRLMTNYRKGVRQWPSDLQDDGYIYRYLGYHLSRAHLMDEFLDAFTDLKFLERKSKIYGVSFVLNDFKCYKCFVNQDQFQIASVESFVRKNACYLSNLDVEQLALNEAPTSTIYQRGMEIIERLISSGPSLYVLPCAINYTYHTVAPVASFQCKIKGGFWMEKEKVFFYIDADQKWGYYSTDTGKHALCSFLPATCKSIMTMPGTCRAVLNFSTFVSMVDLTPYINSTAETRAFDQRNSLTPTEVNPAYLETVFYQSNLTDTDYVVPPSPRSVEEVDVNQEIASVVISHDRRWWAIVTCQGTLIVRQLSEKAKKDSFRLMGAEGREVQQCFFSTDDKRIVYVCKGHSQERCRAVVCDTEGFEEVSAFDACSSPLLYCCWLPTTESNTEQLLFVSCRCAVIRDASNGVPMFTVPSESDICCAATSDDGSRLALYSSVDAALIVWNLTDRLPVCRFAHYETVLYLRFSSLDNELLVARRNDLTIYNISPVHADAVRFIRDFDVIEKDEVTYLLASDFTNQLLMARLPEADAFSLIGELHEQTSCIRWCPSFAYALIGFVTGKIQSYPFVDGQFLAPLTWPAHNDRVTGILFQPDCSHWLSFSMDQSLKVWPMYCHAGMLPTFSDQCTEVTKCVVFHDSSSRLAAFTKNFQMRMYNLLRGGMLFLVSNVHAGEIVDCDVNSDCRWIASASRDGTCKLWTSDQGSCLGELMHLPHAVTCSRFSPTDEYLVTGDALGEIRIFSVLDRRLRHKLTGHSSAVISIHFLNASSQLCMSCASEILFWRSNEDKPLRTYPLTCSAWGEVALLRDKLVVLVDSGGKLYVLKLLQGV